MQQTFYGLFNVLKKNTFPEGYALLWMLQVYLELNGLISLKVHTETMLSMIEKELLQFNNALNVSNSLNRDFQSITNRYWHWQDYTELAMKSNIEGLKVDWGFPKVHLWKHIVRDIRCKGTAHHFSMWPNENMHGALREAYKWWSNGRDCPWPGLFYFPNNWLT